VTTATLHHGISAVTDYFCRKHGI